ncbi:NHL repeat-containing protein [candidate division KSB1 bacterium]
MKQYVPVLLMITLFNCSSNPDTYTVEIIDGVRHMHNFAPLWGDEPKIRLEFVQKIGVLEGDDENYQLYRPYDVEVDENGNIYIMDMGNHRVQIYSPDGKFLSTFGRRGKGPGEFTNAFGIHIGKNGNIYVADMSVGVHIFDSDQKYIKTLKEGVSSFWARAISTGEIVLDKAQDKIVTLVDRDNNVVREIGSRRIYADDMMTRIGNGAAFTTDINDNIYIVFFYQNRIDKYSPGGRLVMQIDRNLPFAETTEYKFREVTDSDGNKSKTLDVNSFSWSIEIDGKNRIWTCTMKRQRTDIEEADNKVETYDLKFEIFDEKGIHLTDIVVDSLKNLTKFGIINDRLFLIDPSKEMAVFEYRIVEKQ